ncbi:hypothetical protein PMAYCL1PPCAC_10870, partial [Pristionchus mayeri]
IDWTIDSLSFIILINSYFQMAIGVTSLIVSVIFAYIIFKSTPEELLDRRASLLSQLFGCVVQSTIFSVFIQPIALLPHRENMTYFEGSNFHRISSKL